MAKQNDLFTLMLAGGAKTGSVSPSVRSFVRQNPGFDTLTDRMGVGDLLQNRLLELLPAAPGAAPTTMTPKFTEYGRAFVGEALAQIVDAPPSEIKPVTQFGKVLVVAVTPRTYVDPVMPLVIGPVSSAYYHHYRAYWSSVLERLRNGFTTRGRVQRLARRVTLAAAQSLDHEELAFFGLWIAHGVLGETRWR